MNCDFDYTVLDKAIEKYGNKESSLIAVLQAAQEDYRYLPKEIFPYLSEKLKLSEAKIYGVATFYAQFSLQPKGEYVVAVCTGTACYVKGAAAVLAEVEKELGIKSGETTPDGVFSIQDTRCLGCCGLAPVMTINNDVYGRLVPSDIKGILEKYRNN